MTDQHIDALHRGAEALVFDIQHLSVKDGPGIRTSIFFKGCPLRCVWCHNPESYIAKKQLSFQPTLCVGCLECTKVCPTGAQGSPLIDGVQLHTVDHQKCIACGKCLEVCCYDALSIIGKTYTQDALFEELRSDLSYYQITTADGARGGVTLSGGEPMQQFEFVCSFLKRLHEAGIHTCMETCGQAPTERYMEIAPYVDLFLFDCKATDSEKHRQFTGVGNELIQKNLHMLSENGAKIVLRLPMIPGVNDDDAHLAAIVKLLNTCKGIDHAEVMAYHTLGLSKCENIGTEARLTGIQPAAPEQKQEWLERLRSFGAQKPVMIG